MLHCLSYSRGVNACIEFGEWKWAISFHLKQNFVSGNEPANEKSMSECANKISSDYVDSLGGLFHPLPLSLSLFEKCAHKRIYNSLKLWCLYRDNGRVCCMMRISNHKRLEFNPYMKLFDYEITDWAPGNAQLEMSGNWS